MGAPSTDALLGVFAASLCDVVAGQIMEVRSALMALEKKRLLSSSEFQQAKKRNPS
jgi:hypothetical protein